MLALCEFALPLAALLLFVWAVVQCVLCTVRPQPTLAGEEPRREDARRAALACLLVGAAWQGAICLWALRTNPDATLLQALQNQLYGNTDARHYIDLAQYGYGTGEAFSEQYLMIVFFPLFPLLLQILNPWGVLDWGALALAVQLPLAALWGAGLYRLTCRHYGLRTARWSLALLLASPAAVFFFAPMTESLFLALCVGYTLCLEKGRWPLCFVLGLLAGLCRAPGGLLAGMAVLYLAKDFFAGKRPPVLSLLAAAGPVCGLLAYFGMNQAIYGKWNQYAVYQKEHWNNGLGWFTDTIRYHLQTMASWWQDGREAAVYICLTAVLCILCMAAVLACSARTVPPHWLGFGLAYFALTMGATWLISAPRYAVALFCLPTGLAASLQRYPRLRRCVFVVLLVLGIWYGTAWLEHRPIY